MTELAAGKAPTVARLQDKRARLLASGERIDTIVAATTAELHEVMRCTNIAPLSPH